MSFTFGIYPFGFAGMASGAASGPPDDFTKLPAVIEQLRGGRKLLLRTYGHFTGDDAAPGILTQIEFIARSGLPWDFVLCFRQEGPQLAGWLRLIEEIVARYGNILDALQITNEANLRHVPDAADGSRPHVRQALAYGVVTAKQAVVAHQATVKIGFNAVPTFHEPDDFWSAIVQFDGAFIAALDYVGLDFYPDVFGAPIALEDLPAASENILRNFRKQLADASIPATLPLRICENGWPTGPTRPAERQAQVLETVIRTVYRLRAELNITHYELFGLRDADSSNENSFFQFGIVHDDYSPKPAFAVYQRLIQELSE
jgi:hypothetical protein